MAYKGFVGVTQVLEGKKRNGTAELRSNDGGRWWRDMVVEGVDVEEDEKES